MGIEKLYVKYSIFERFFMLCFGIFCLMTIFSIGIMLEYKTMVSFKIIFLLLIVTVIRIFKKDYSMKRYSSHSLSISEKKKEIYVMEDFSETDEKLIINYGNTKVLLPDLFKYPSNSMGLKFTLFNFTHLKSPLLYYNF